jgi:hypothetical protein
MSNENLIAFTSVQPVVEELDVIYTAKLGDREIRTGITKAAFEALRSGVASQMENDLALSSPAHGEAQAAIQRKYDLEGLDNTGGILVTEEDLVAHNGLND